MGPHFKVLNEAVLMALSKILEILIPFRVSQPPCVSIFKRAICSSGCECAEAGPEMARHARPKEDHVHGQAWLADHEHVHDPGLQGQDASDQHQPGRHPGH